MIGDSWLSAVDWVRRSAHGYSVVTLTRAARGGKPEASKLVRVQRARSNLVKHYAFTLAHIASGWEVGWDFRAQAEQLRRDGHIYLDLLEGTAELDGIPTLLGIFHVVRHWIDAQLVRDGLPVDWLADATVELRYVRANVEQGFQRYDLVSTGSVRTEYGSRAMTVRNHTYAESVVEA